MFVVAAELLLMSLVSLHPEATTSAVQGAVALSQMPPVFRLVSLRGVPGLNPAALDALSRNGAKSGANAETTSFTVRRGR
jgi:hypothetical protein